MIRKSFPRGLLGLTFLTFALISCGNLFDQGKDDEPPLSPALSGMSAVIASVDATLSSLGYTSPERSVLKTGATAAVESGNLSSSDYETYMPLAVAGAVAAIGDIPDRGEQWRLDCAAAVTGAYVDSLAGRTEATLAAPSYRAASAPSSASLALCKILSRISAAAVSNLSATGIVPDRIGEAAGKIAGTMIESLGSAGVNRVLVNDAVSNITDAAVRSLAAAGLTDGEARGYAAASVAEGAISAIPSILVPGVSNADYGPLIDSIAGAATKAALAEAPAGSDPAVIAGMVAVGAGSGLSAVLASESALSAGETQALVQTLARAVVNGALSAQTIDPSLDGAGLVSAVTGTLSQVLSEGVPSSGLTAESIGAGVTVGAASAITSLSNEIGCDPSAMLDGIQLKDDSGTTVAVSAEDVASGVELGNNEAPAADIGPDFAVETGSPTVLSASLSSDGDGDELSFSWKLDVRPEASQAALQSVSGDSCSLTPDVKGLYIVSCKVTDPLGASSTAYVTVSAVASAASAVWNGKTATERLALARGYEQTGELDRARDEYLSVLAHYPETDAHVEASCSLGLVYKKMGYNKLGDTWLKDTIAKWPEADISMAARLSLASRPAKNADDIAFSTGLYETVIEERPGTRFEAEALFGLGRLSRNSGDYAAAETLYLSARDHAAATLNTRSEAQKSYAELAALAGNLDTAVSRMLEVLTAARYNREDPEDPATEDASVLFACEYDLGSGMLDIGGAYAAQGITRLTGTLDNAKYGPELKLRAVIRLGEYYLWNSDKTTANAEAARDLIAAALAANTGTSVPVRKGRAEANKLLGYSYQRLYDLTGKGSVRDGYVAAALASWKNGAEGGLTAWWSAETAAVCAIESATTQMWQKRNFDAAKTILLKVIAEYNDERFPGPLAWAYARLGQVYREIAYNAAKQYGADQEYWFRQAIASYGRAKPEYFPSLDPNQGYFFEAREGLGTCYAEIGEYQTARSILSECIADSAVDAESRAWAQRTLGYTWRKEAEIAANGGDFAVALSRAAAAEAEYDKVSFYVDGNDDWVQNGRPLADSYLDTGYMYIYIGDRMQDNGWRQSRRQDLLDCYGLAETAFLKISDASFAALRGADPGAWPLIDRWPGLQNARLQREDYAGALAAADEWISRIDDGEIGEEQRANAISNRANISKREMDFIDLYNADPAELPGLKARVLELADLALQDFDAVFALDKTLDGGNAAAWALENLGWMRNRLCDWNLFASRTVALQTIKGYADDYAARLAAAGAFTDGAGNPAPNSWAKQSARNALGSLWRQYADALRMFENPAQGTWETEYRTVTDRGITEWLSLAEDPETEPWRVNEVRVSLIDVYFERARMREADAPDFFKKLRDTALSVLVDPDAHSWYVARSLMRLGWAYLEFGEELVGVRPDLDLGIDADEDWKVAAKFYFNLVLNTGAYRESDSGIAQSCQEGLDSEALRETADSGMFDFVSLLPPDGQFHMVADSGGSVKLYFSLASETALALSWSDSKDGGFPGETDVTVTLATAGGLVLVDRADSGYAVPRDLGTLVAGRYYLTVATDDPRGVNCRIRLAVQ